MVEPLQVHNNLVSVISITRCLQQNPDIRTADPVIVNYQADLEARESVLPCDPKLGEVVILDGFHSF